MINSGHSIQINIKFTFTGYEYIIVYKYILLSCEYWEIFKNPHLKDIYERLFLNFIDSKC